MKKFFTLIVALAITLIGSTSFAAEKLIEASGEYVMDSRLDETTASATARAREEAKRAVVDKAGVYLQSHSKIIDLELVEDEVETVAARLLKIQSESSKIDVINDNLLRFTVTIKALVNDLSDADLKALMQDKQSLGDATRKYKELQEKYNDLKAQMENLKRSYDTASDTQRIEIKREVARNTENFSAVEAMGRGNEFYFVKNYSQALTAYDEALRLNPQFAEAYNNRGIVKYELNQYTAAIEDYSTAIRLKSNFADALNNRGNAYAALKQFNEAAQDLQAALKLKPDFAIGHNNLGNVYSSMKNYDAAISEYTQAIQLNPKFAEAYYNRAAIRYGQGKYLEALSDIKTSMDLNSANSSIRDLYNRIIHKTS